MRYQRRPKVTSEIKAEVWENEAPSHGKRPDLDPEAEPDKGMHVRLNAYERHRLSQLAKADRRSQQYMVRQAIRLLFATVDGANKVPPKDQAGTEVAPSQYHDSTTTVPSLDHSGTAEEVPRKTG